MLRSLVLSLGLFLYTSNDSLSVLALPMIEKSFCVELHEVQFKIFNTAVLLLLGLYVIFFMSYKWYA